MTGVTVNLWEAIMSDTVMETRIEGASLLRRGKGRDLHGWDD